MAVDAGTIYSEVRIALDKLRRDIQQVQQNMDRLGPISKKSSDKMAGTWKTGFNQIKIAAAAAFAAVALAVRSAVSTFAGFEQAIANVQSVARGTPEEFNAIRDAAQEAGETTRFTASQAADALYYLASAGFTAEESMGALNGVLQLAGATQSDLAFTSEAVAAAISQFGLEAEDAVDVANIFTASIQNSQATMEKLAQSLAYVGPVASGLGYTLEETAGILQILYNNGLAASTAGTALRSALADLANASSPAVRRLEELGIAFDDINPATNDFASIIDILNGAAIDAGEAMALFGNRAGPALIKLLEAGGDEIRDFTDAVTDTNAAAEAYAIQNDTLAGSIDRLKSATESTAISFAGDWAPAIRGVVDLMTRLVSAVGRLPAPIRVFISALVIGVPTIVAAAAGFAALSTAMAAAGISLTALLGPITLVVAGLAAVGAGFVAIRNAVNRSRIENVRENFAGLAEELGRSEEEMAGLVRQAERLGATEEDIDAVVRKLSELQRQANLSNSEMRQLRRVVNRMASDSAGYEKILDLITRINAETGLSAREVERMRDYLSESVHFGADLQTLAGETALEYGISLENAYALLGTLENLTDEQRTQVGRLQSESAELAELTQRRQQIADLTGEAAAAQVRSAAAARAEAEAAERAAIAEEERLAALEAQARLEEAYVAARSEVLRIINGEATEMDRIREQIEYLNAHPWAPGFLEEDRLRALAILNEELEQLQALQEKLREAESSALESQIAAATELKRAAQEQREADARALQFAELAAVKAKEAEEATRNQAAAERELAAAAEQARAAIERSASEQERQNEIVEAARAELGRYVDRLEALGATDAELIELERERAIEAVRATGITGEAYDVLIGKVNEYYDALTETEQWERFVANATTAIAQVSSLFGDLGSLFLAVADQRVEALDRQLQAELEAAGLAEETTIERLQRELEEAEAEGDAETAAKLKDEIERERITAEYEKRKAQVIYRAELSAWRLKVLGGIADAAAAILKAVASAPWPLNLPAIGFATATGLVNLSTIKQQKPEAPQLATGGIVLPAAGGVPTVQAENGYPELSLNGGPEGVALLEQFAGAIARNMSGGGEMILVLEMDGQRVAESVVGRMNNGQVRVKL